MTPEREHNDAILAAMKACVHCDGPAGINGPVCSECRRAFGSRITESEVALLLVQSEIAWGRFSRAVRDPEDAREKYERAHHRVRAGIRMLVAQAREDAKREEAVYE